MKYLVVGFLLTIATYFLYSLVYTPNKPDFRSKYYIVTNGDKYLIRAKRLWIFHHTYPVVFDSQNEAERGIVEVLCDIDNKDWIIKYDKWEKVK